MAAKRIDAAQAKAAKQKKIAIVGVILLVAVLAIQGPKTLKMLKGPQATPVAAPVGPGGPAVPETGGPASPAPAAGGPATPGGPPAGATPPVATAELASVPDSDQAPVVDDGQLATFQRFSSKDPFAQQAETVTPQPAQAPAKSDPTKSADPATSSEPAKDADPAKGGTAEGTIDGGFTTGGTKPPAGATVAATTSIAVNGVAEDVQVETPFPAAEPTFVLASIAADGKSVEIGVAGGEYANGGETLKLALGKTVTLQNTADGSRYELELLSILGFPLPKQKG
jgi:hypothetical protein